MRPYRTYPGAANYISHIPGPNGRTYCGRLTALVNCIDIRTESLENAECLACQRSNDRRVKEDLERSTKQ